MYEKGRNTTTTKKESQMTYYESAANQTINLKECEYVLGQHSIENDDEFQAWFTEHQNHGMVRAQKLLEWLGY